jgi:hypothetical protein
MKTYLNIKNSSQLKINDTLVEFYTNSNEIWQFFKVHNVDHTGVTLLCKSNSFLFVSNENLNNKEQYFKRI